MTSVGSNAVSASAAVATSTVPATSTTSVGILQKSAPPAKKRKDSEIVSENGDDNDDDNNVDESDDEKDNLNAKKAKLSAKQTDSGAKFAKNRDEMRRLCEERKNQLALAANVADTLSDVARVAKFLDGGDPTEFNLNINSVQIFQISKISTTPSNKGSIAVFNRSVAQKMQKVLFRCCFSVVFFENVKHCRTI